MADRYLLESGSPDGYLLEDGSGVLLIDAPTIAAYKDSLSGGDNSFAASTISATAPTVAVGDIEVIWCAAGALAPTVAPTFSTPAGWNSGGNGGSVAAVGGVVNTRLHLFWRISPDTGSAATLDAGTNCALIWMRESYTDPSGGSSLAQVSFGSDAGGDTSVVVSSLTATADSLLSIGITQGAAQAITPPGGTNERIDNATFGISAFDEIAAGGATGTRTFTLPANADAAWGFAEFDPAAAGNNQSLAITLDGVTVASSQTLQHSQSLAATLDSITVAASQNRQRSQSLAITLDGVTVAASQAATHPQSLAITLEGIAFSASQSIGAANNQTMAVTLDGVTIAASQAVQHPQSLTATLDGVTVAVSQKSNHPQSLAITLGGVTVSASQTSTHPQSLAVTLDGVTFAASQQTAGAKDQVISFTLDGVSAFSSQTVSHGQTGAFTLDDIEVSIIQPGSEPADSVELLGGGPGSPKKRKTIEKGSYLERLLSPPILDRINEIDQDAALVIEEQAAEVVKLSPIVDNSEAQMRKAIESAGIAYKQAYQEIYLELVAEMRQAQDDEAIATVLASLL